MTAPIRLAVIGDPVGHSISPQIFSFLFDRLVPPIQRAKYSYESIRVTRDQLSKFLEDAKHCFLGVNVTIPHKEKILSQLDTVAPQAQTIGAVNCIHFDLKLKGYNTDVRGFADSLNDSGFDSNRCSAVILGAGGAARAVVYALGSACAAKVFILNRNLDSAKKLADFMSRGFPDTQFEAIGDVSKLGVKIDLIVNATPLGMSGVIADSRTYFMTIFDQLRMNRDAIAVDLVYRPLNTPFLQIARELGIHTVAGTGMLVSQALASWEIWFGAIENKANVKQELELEVNKWLSADSPVERIFLTGFMGVGKSTVGKTLAERLGWDFIDSDQLIEKTFNKSITEIFQDGETKFRNEEERILRETCQASNAVIALGGGSLNRTDVRNLVKKSGLLIYLSASESVLLSRLGDTAPSRPLLRHSPAVSLQEHIATLLKPRLSIYNDATVEFSTDGMTPEQVVAKIVKHLGLELK